MAQRTLEEEVRAGPDPVAEDPLAAPAFHPLSLVVGLLLVLLVVWTLIWGFVGPF